LSGIPESIAFDLNNGNTYAIVPDNDGVQVISGKNNSVIASISFDDPSVNFAASPTDIAFNPRNGEMYVSAQTFLYNFTSGALLDNCADRNTRLKCAVYLIDTKKNNTVIDTIPVDSRPANIAFDPNNSKIYVLHRDSRENGPGKITLIDAKNNTVIKTLDVGNGTGKLNIDFNANNNESYVVNQGFGEINGSSGTVSVIDAKNNTVIRTIPVNILPFTISSDPINGNTYVGNQESRTVSVIDAKNNTVIRTIPVNGMPTDISFNQKNGDMYLAVGLPNSIYVIDAKNNTVIDTIPVNGIPNNIAFNQNNGDIYVTNSYPDVVSVIDHHTNKIVETIPLKMQTLKINFNPTNGNMYVTNKINNTIAVINP
jgi:YVTN family beta-propeller protein